MNDPAVCEDWRSGSQEVSIRGNRTNVHSSQMGKYELYISFTNERYSSGNGLAKKTSAVLLSQLEDEHTDCK